MTTGGVKGLNEIKLGMLSRVYGSVSESRTGPNTGKKYKLEVSRLESEGFGR